MGERVRSQISKMWVFIFLSYSSPAMSWDKHQSFMPLILEGASAQIQQILDLSFKAPCEEEDRATLQMLTAQLQLNPQTQVSLTLGQPCHVDSQISVREILLGTSVDDPDQGMDQDLPKTRESSYDPKQARKWMGGPTGIASQSFRHSYYGGWKLNHPITTLQFPPYSIGEAPLRVEIMALKARELLRAGQSAWGTRLVAWALHYLQDLNQPFHTVQVISFQIVPWYKFLTWPPSRALNEVIQETFRMNTNLHWGYEGYTRIRLIEGDSSPFIECLSKPEQFTKLDFNPKIETPLELAFEIVHHSVGLAPGLGVAELQFFGPLLTQPDLDLTKNPNVIDYAEYAIRPDLNEPREILQEITCQALSNTSLSTQRLIEWAFQP